MGVFTMIAKSSSNDFCCAYWMSKEIICLNVVRFFPLTCHKPVSPGAAANRAFCASEYSAYS